jgi:Arc/MetJ-type ribon-helix-helix transcriptional regulator
MVKERISATVDKKTAELIKRILKKRRFRNKSHIIEEAIELIAKKVKNEK